VITTSRFRSPHARPRRALRVTAAATAVLLAGGLAACSGDEASTTPVAATPPVASTPAPPPPTSPFTGEVLEDGKTKPVLVIKVDNTSSALPHEGIDAADIVYVEQVEGGITRLAAVFSSTLPKAVVPIRSARETDAELLTTFGKVPVAFSGAVDSVHRLVQSSGLQDISQDMGGDGYYRVSGRYAPYNLAGTPSELIKRAKKVQARDIGFRFGALPVGGKPVEEISAAYAGSRVSFDYNAKKNTYGYSLNGEADQVPGKAQVAADTVIVQSVPVGTVSRADGAGTTVPFMKTTGSGKAKVFRDGQMFKVRWTRQGKNAPTQFTTPDGADFPLNVGKVWVVLFPDDRKLVVS
jgi:hypothetical protein